MVCPLAVENSYFDVKFFKLKIHSFWWSWTGRGLELLVICLRRGNIYIVCHNWLTKMCGESLSSQARTLPRNQEDVSCKRWLHGFPNILECHVPKVLLALVASSVDLGWTRTCVYRYILQRISASAFTCTQMEPSKNRKELFTGLSKISQPLSIYWMRSPHLNNIIPVHRLDFLAEKV